MKNLQWPTALVVSVALVCIVVLAIIGADTSDLMLILVSLGLGAGGEQLRGLRQQTNGNVTRLMDEVAEMRRALAQLAGVRSQEPPHGG